MSFGVEETLRIVYDFVFPLAVLLRGIWTGSLTLVSLVGYVLCTLAKTSTR